MKGDTTLRHKSLICTLFLAAAACTHKSSHKVADNPNKATVNAVDPVGGDFALVSGIPQEVAVDLTQDSIASKNTENYSQWTLAFDKPNLFRTVTAGDCRLITQRLNLPEMANVSAISTVFNPEVKWSGTAEEAMLNPMLFKVKFNYKMVGEESPQAFELNYALDNLEEIAGNFQSVMDKPVYWEDQEVQGIPEWVEISVCNVAAKTEIKANSLGLKVFVD